MVSKKSLTPFFSLITCTKNSAKYLPTCLDSVVAQTFRNFEHIVIDGESTDATPKLLKLTGIKFYTAPAQGIAHAMNLGISQARGQYLYFLNSDDSLYSPNVLQEVHDHLIANPKLDWAYGRIHEVSADGTTVGFPPSQALFHAPHPNLLKFYNYIPHQAAFVKREVFAKFGNFDESLSSMMDDEFWLRIAPHTNWDYLDTIVANYLIREDSQSESTINKAANNAEWEAVQARYLHPFERPLAKLLNKLLR